MTVFLFFLSFEEKLIQSNFLLSLTQARKKTHIYNVFPEHYTFLKMFFIIIIVNTCISV